MFLYFEILKIIDSYTNVNTICLKFLKYLLEKEFFNNILNSIAFNEFWIRLKGYPHGSFILSDAVH